MLNTHVTLKAREICEAICSRDGDLTKLTSFISSFFFKEMLFELKDSLQNTQPAGKILCAFYKMHAHHEVHLTNPTNCNFGMAFNKEQ